MEDINGPLKAQASRLLHGSLWVWLIRRHPQRDELLKYIQAIADRADDVMLPLSLPDALSLEVQAQALGLLQIVLREPQ